MLLLLVFVCGLGRKATPKLSSLLDTASGLQGFIFFIPLFVLVLLIALLIVAIVVPFPLLPIMPPVLLLVKISKITRLTRSVYSFTNLDQLVGRRKTLFGRSVMVHCIICWSHVANALRAGFARI